MLTWCHHLPHENGVFYALKGQLNTEEMQAIPKGFKLLDTLVLKVPQLDEQRHLIKLVRIAE
jgi:16S rRNA (guanine527-N7)-methyltransferase